MELRIMEDWLQENFNEGEIQKYIDDHEFTEYDLHFLHNSGIIDLTQNFTLMRGVVIGFSSNNASEVQNETFKNISQEFQKFFNSSMEEGLKLDLDYSEDCNISFYLKLPANSTENNNGTCI